mgnify:FL=1
MTTISFKADTALKNNLQTVARNKGINTSAYIKLVLTEKLENDLSRITENGFTVAEELEILRSFKHDKRYGPFKTADEFMRALRRKK